VVLDGMIDYVSDAAAAEVILVAHCDDRGLSVVAVDGRDQSVRAVPLVNVDETRRFASLTFDGTRGEVVGALGGGEAWFSRAMDRSISALAVECVGGAQKCLEMAVDYAKERFTFGRAIGSYQAIKHKCADMKIAVDAATAAAAWAVQESAEDGEALPSAAALAKAYCPEAYFRVAGDNIQIHGGLGFTWECPAHLYFKRAKASELFLGSGALYRKRLSQELRETFQAAS
jgi:alkylation response protein AidB-like acyl-CoA dehydrogenase